VAKKLFNVTIETQVIIAADSEEEAAKIFEDGDILRDLENKEFDCQVEEFSHMPPGWEPQSIPFGNNCDLYIEEYPEYATMKERCRKRAEEYRERQKKRGD